MNTFTIGQKISDLRTKRSYSQQQLADALGWNHHQTVSELEQGHREVKAWELSKIAQLFAVPMDFFLEDTSDSQPLVLWRAGPQKKQALLEENFLRKCSDFTMLEELVEGKRIAPRELPLVSLQINRWQLSDAYRLASEVRHRLDLGAYPAYSLVPVLEEKFGVKFIGEDGGNGPSAACSRSEKGCFIWINETEKSSRRNFSIAHELFHLITFETALLDAVKNNPKLHEKNELLADAFAAGLLVPEEQLRLELSRFGPKLELSDVVALSRQFQVSPEAFMHRLHNLKLMAKPQMEDYRRRLKSYPFPNHEAPSLMRRYISLVYLALQHGKLSRAKAAKLLDTDLCDLKSTLTENGYPLLK